MKITKAEIILLKNSIQNELNLASDSIYNKYPNILSIIENLHDYSELKEEDEFKLFLIINNDEEDFSIGTYTHPLVDIYYFCEENGFDDYDVFSLMDCEINKTYVTKDTIILRVK